MKVNLYFSYFVWLLNYLPKSAKQQVNSCRTLFKKLNKFDHGW